LKQQLVIIVTVAMVTGDKFVCILNVDSFGEPLHL